MPDQSTTPFVASQGVARWNRWKLPRANPKKRNEPNVSPFRLTRPCKLRGFPRGNPQEMQPVIVPLIGIY